MDKVLKTYINGQSFNIYIGEDSPALNIGVPIKYYGEVSVTFDGDEFEVSIDKLSPRAQYLLDAGCLALGYCVEDNGKITAVRLHYSTKERTRATNRSRWTGTQESIGEAVLLTPGVRDVQFPIDKIYNTYNLGKYLRLANKKQQPSVDTYYMDVKFILYNTFGYSDNYVCTWRAMKTKSNIIRIEKDYEQ